MCTRAWRHAAATLVCLAAVSGCVQRRMTIRSDPPGALVLVDGEEVGFTPVSVDFTYYATREITLKKDGFETLTVMQKFRKPWYQQPPLEFFSDNFALRRIHDRHDLSYRLQPLELVTNSELLERATSLRNEAHISPE